MTTLTEEWLQEVVDVVQLPAVEPSVTNAILPAVEAHIKLLIQLAEKFQRRGKSKVFTVDHFNQALSSIRVEQVYGLSPNGDGAVSGSTPGAYFGPNVMIDQDSEAAASKPVRLNLVELAKQPLPRLPLQADLHLHWLAVHGVQPNIPDNPLHSADHSASVVHAVSLLPKELQVYYARVTGVLGTSSPSSSSVLSVVLDSLERDDGLQELLPHISRFIYQLIKANSRSSSILHRQMLAIRALVCNPTLNLEFHLQQLLPAVFTCVLGAKLSEDHIALRRIAAQVVSWICTKYIATFPDIQSRACKTFIEALAPEKPLCCVLGGLLGLSKLGSLVVKNILLTRLPLIVDRIESEQKLLESQISSILSGTASAGGGGAAAAAAAAGGGGGGRTGVGRGSSVDKKRRGAANTLKKEVEAVINQLNSTILTSLGVFIVEFLKDSDDGVSALRPRLISLIPATRPFSKTAARGVNRFKNQRALSQGLAGAAGDSSDGAGRVKRRRDESGDVAAGGVSAGAGAGVGTGLHLSHLKSSSVPLTSESGRGGGGRGRGGRRGPSVDVIPDNIRESLVPYYCTLTASGYCHLFI